MRIGIVDADLLGRRKHRFPNLVCEKISGYWKSKGAEVVLLTDYTWFGNENENISLFDSETENQLQFDRVYVSKVFTDTPIPDGIAQLAHHPLDPDYWIQIGGTGFFFDKAPNLPYEIEHHMPDYHLYDAWIKETVDQARASAEALGKKFSEKSFMVQFKEYTDYSIGFTTRGCFRKCAFCVNQKFDHVFMHSPIEEFYDASRPKICLLDDNILGCPQWKSIIEELQSTGKPFKFKQGMDERLLTDERCKVLFASKYDADYTFAFDNIEDYELIHRKLQLIRKYTNATNIKFYVLVGFRSTDAEDIENAFRRIEMLQHYKCLPYLMRYMSPTEAPWQKSKYRGMYVSLARWCNQPNMIKKMTFREFCLANQALHKTEGSYCSAMQAMVDFENEYPEIAARYFDNRYGEPNPKFIEQ